MVCCIRQLLAIQLLQLHCFTPCQVGACDRPPCRLPSALLLQHDLYDALFYVRILAAALLGTGFGVIGAQGLMVFLL